MKPITIQQPRRFVFGDGCLRQCLEDLQEAGYRKLFIVSSPPLQVTLDEVKTSWEEAGGELAIYDRIEKEPDIATFETVRQASRAFGPEAVVGLGGGSALDVAKLVAAFSTNEDPVRDTFGIGFLKGRDLHLVCVPTTAGTGSEVSPNAILLDETEALKKGIVSPHLMPDGAYIDPELTHTVPPAVTAATGVDAMTHCIEAFANKFSHPVIDHYALEGTRRIAAHLESAIADGKNREARSNLALGSVYGGICLGPVNTGAVHALAYPLGGEYHIAHGVSNAVLLPHVLKFNLPSATDRYAQLGDVFGLPAEGSEEARAQAAIDWLFDFVNRCGIPQHLSEFGIQEQDIPHLAKEAMKVTRLLKNNPREVTETDAESIYRAAF